MHDGFLIHVIKSGTLLHIRNSKTDTPFKGKALGLSLRDWKFIKLIVFSSAQYDA